MKYTTPFCVRESVIYDASGRKVKLWGVNYYAPFNHNYFNVEELGKDHFAAIDTDLRHLALLGSEFMRMHLYDREISDRFGHLVANKQLRVFDYLIDQCEKNGVYLMITPMAWWNTVANQINLDKSYAYWYADDEDAFGFSNFFSVDAMIWNSDAIQCQETYLHELFTHKNAFSGKTLAEYSNIVVIELFNEPQFPGIDILKHEPNLNWQGNGVFSRGSLRKRFIEKWNVFRAGHTALSEEECYSEFRTDCVKNYFEHLWPVVDKYFGNKVIHAQFSSYSGAVAPELRSMYENCGIQAITIGTYLNANGFDGGNTDSADHLAMAERWFNRFSGPKGNFARIAYEFDASSSLSGYPLAALAAQFAKNDVQMAAFFTYTPFAVATWNPGWLVHFLNIAHTPARAAGFAAAGDIFRANEPDDPLEIEVNHWTGKNYEIERTKDFVSVRLPETCRYTQNADGKEFIWDDLKQVSGRGTSALAACSGNGCYFLTLVRDGEWRLELFPSQTYLTDPSRGKIYGHMANRYINCRKETPVSLLLETVIEFELKGKRITACRTEDGTRTIPVCSGKLQIPAGCYLLTVE